MRHKKLLLFTGWERLGVKAGFTTRHFPFILKKTGELLEAANQQALTKALNDTCAARFVFLDQVHGDRIETVDDPVRYARPGYYRLKGADGVITNMRGVTLLVLTADCLPIFFRAGDSWAGLVHAGWRGTQKQIARKAFQTLVAKSGCPPSEVSVAFGPCIRSDYEVGDEFLDYFPKSSLERRNRKLVFDLAAENKRQLVAAGAGWRRITDPALCTMTHGESFYSHRREKEQAGRTISFITVL